MTSVLTKTAGTAFLLFACVAQSQASDHVLYAFKGGSDGAEPDSNLISDASSNLYGTTDIGGGSGCEGGGCGTIFKLAPDGTETVLHAFQGGNDGALPDSGLTRDGAGNFFGTTSGGDARDEGTVFKLTPNGTETVLYAFTGGSDGGEPFGLTRDSSGNLYGTTNVGGIFGGVDCGLVGCGTVFEVSPAGKETVLYAFQGGNDGFEPASGVIRDRNGNYYGTTTAGGTGNNCGGGGFSCGTVFKVGSDDTETVLYSFHGGNDGDVPIGMLLIDSAGNLYGTTVGGGTAGQGTVFKLATDGAETVLYSFKGGSDGEGPVAGVIMDKSGNLYGTTYNGGGTGCKQTGHIGCGTVFKLAPDGTETILVKFGGKRGTYPAASLLLKHGVLYGTASAGGANKDGVVFKVKP